MEWTRALRKLERSRTPERRRSLATGFALAALAATAATVATSGAEAARTTAPSERAVLRALGELPLRYEENLGQTHEDFGFVARAAGHRVHLARAGSDGPVALLTPDRGGAAVALRVLGVDAYPAPRASEPLPGVSHYLVGPGPEGWQRDVRGYARVTYASLRPGIDLVFRGRGREVEFDFVIAPEADPGAIALAFDGARELRLAADGAIAIDAGNGRELRVHPPLVYQERAGARHEVEGSFVLREDAVRGSVVAFELGRYDASAPLVIDPVLSWSTYLGASSSDVALDLDVDASGNAYVVGHTSSVDFPTTGGAFDTTANGGVDVFVTKLAADGGSLVWSTYFGGSLDDNFSNGGIAVDGFGQAHIAGVTLGGGLPTTAGVFQPSFAGGSDCYVAKLSADGASLGFSTYLGGNLTDRCRDVAVDATGRTYVTGLTQGGTFPVSIGAWDTTFAGPTEAFVAAFGSAGSLVYSTLLGGSLNEEGYGIAVDDQQRAAVTGDTSSSDFPTASAFQAAQIGGFDGFVTKLNATGTGVVFSTYLGGSSRDRAARIACDGAGDVYVTGETDSSDFPTSSGAFQETAAAAGFTDAFVVKLSSGGLRLFSSYLGGDGLDRGNGIAVRGGGALVTGETRSSDFPTVDPVQASRGGIPSDAFVALFSADGASLDFSTYLGGNMAENNADSSGVGVDAAGDVYFAGITGSLDFPTTSGAFQETDPGGSSEAFVAKITLPLPIPLLGVPALVVLAVALVGVAAAGFAASRRPQA